MRKDRKSDSRGHRPMANGKEDVGHESGVRAEFGDPVGAGKPVSAGHRHMSENSKGGLWAKCLSLPIAVLRGWRLRPSGRVPATETLPTKRACTLKQGKGAEETLIGNMTHDDRVIDREIGWMIVAEQSFDCSVESTNVNTDRLAYFLKEVSEISNPKTLARYAIGMARASKPDLNAFMIAACHRGRELAYQFVDEYREMMERTNNGPLPISDFSELWIFEDEMVSEISRRELKNLNAICEEIKRRWLRGSS